MQKEDLMMGMSANSMIGLPIFAINNGRRIASVKDVIYDGMRSRLLAFTIEQAGVFSPKRLVLPFENIKSIGRDAVVVENADAFVSERQMADIRDIAEHGKSVDSKVLLTESGVMLGHIADVLIDETTGHAVSYEISGGITKDIGSGRNYVAAPTACVVGIDAIIVPDETETTLAQQEPGGLVGAYGEARARGQEYGRRTSAYTQAQEIKLSRGKVAGSDVYDDEGNLIIARGEVVTETVIDHAVRAGKMHQVAMAAGVGGVAAGYEATRAQAGGAQSLWDQTETKLSEAWDNLKKASHDSADRAGRKRAVSAQKKFLEGKIAAVDIGDLEGNVFLYKGDVITPLILDTLDRKGLLEKVKVQPEVEEEATAIHVVMEKPEVHERHKVRPHI